MSSALDPNSEVFTRLLNPAFKKRWNVNETKIKLPIKDKRNSPASTKIKDALIVATEQENEFSETTARERAVNK
jgi:hypothetical protein